MLVEHEIRVADRVAAKHIWLSWLEARPAVQGIFTLRFICGALLADYHTDGVVWPRVIAVMACWIAAMWAVYVINGIADIVEDRENGSARPIAQGVLPLRSAKAVASALCVLAIGSAALISPVVCALVLALLAVGYAYSMGPRPLKGNVPGFFGAVVALGCLTYLAGWYAAGAGHVDAPLVLFGAAMSLWMGFGGATKDLSDTAGDQIAGRRTLPVVLGDRAARAAMAIGASLVGWGFLLASLLWMPSLAQAGFVVCAGSIVLAIVVTSAVSQGDRFSRRRPYRVFMITQYAAHLVLLMSMILK
ncbi:homogenitisate phytyltransferase [Lentzea tibetensis]|uniref:Homogenitisate phytyltransferase n=1 Tax=Lentzea tibetensis TaxID=2591470 RepID=A0A563F1K5_9PSEU|nr:UbiA family prenyltransferase [Lentzea tibetensis]TWP53783.1 homogenitisate phytyltransferase [Lentzea tibetensis]